MVRAFGLALKASDEIFDEVETEPPAVLNWWENGSLLIYPDKPLHLAWNIFKSLVLGISFFVIIY